MNADAGAASLKPPLLELRSVSKRFVKHLDIVSRVANVLGSHLREEVVHAVDRVTLTVREKEVVGLVGESGCGKSTTALAAIGYRSPGSLCGYCETDCVRSSAVVRIRLCSVAWAIG